MAGSASKTYGPAYIAAAATNVLAPPANTYAIVTKIHVINRDSATRTFTLYKGATGGSTAGTELCGPDYSLAAAGSSSAEKDIYGRIKLVGGTDYLVGIASSASKVVIEVEYELYALDS